MNYKYINGLITILLSVLLVRVCYFNNVNNNELISAFAQNKDNPYYIHVDLDLTTLYVFKDGELYKSYPCSGDKYSTPSPLGTWTIVSKANWGEGFGGTWMGFNVPWGK